MLMTIGIFVSLYPRNAPAAPICAAGTLRLSNAVSPTYKETFETVLHFAELHADIIEQFGRFPHRNKILERENTPKEDEYLAGDVPAFGQSKSS